MGHRKGETAAEGEVKGMCFYNDDYDWIARQIEEEDRVEDRDCRCLECRQKIPAGTELHYVYMQEYEECQACENGECACNDGEPVDDSHECRCDKPDFGSVYEYRRCLNCHRLLQAIEDVELERGCRHHEARPMLEQMQESLQEMGWSDARPYLDTCLAKHPEMSAWLDMLAKGLWDDEERATATCAGPRRCWRAAPDGH